MNVDERLQWMLEDARAEGTRNPLKKAYHRAKMHMIEKKSEKQFTVRLPADLHNRLRHACLDDNISMNDLFIRFAEQYLQSREQPTNKTPDDSTQEKK